MRLQMGDYNQLEVLRITDFSYILGDGETEVFLHKRQANGEIEVGSKVNVFLYYDNQKRITATMNHPIIDQDKAGWVEVVDINFHLGAFLQIGIQKDLLLSRDDLSHMKKEWPQKGDMVFATLKVSKNQLTAKLISRYQIKDYIKPTEPLVVGEKYEAYNVYKTEEGTVFFTKEGHYIFVYFKHLRKTYRLGEKETIIITIDKGDFTYNGSVNEQKELMMDEDAGRIVSYLQRHHGEMEYTDKTDAEVITQIFHMSKGAFKRALGTLYKQKLVLLEDGKTTLIKSLNNEEE